MLLLDLFMYYNFCKEKTVTKTGNHILAVYPIIDFYPLDDILKLCIINLLAHEQLILASVRLNFHTAIITEERAYII